MTTFTTEDREALEKGLEFFNQLKGEEVIASPPHIVDSGASVMNKTLTDEEIIQVLLKSPLIDEIGMFKNTIEFAKAILRKAQEK